MADLIHKRCHLAERPFKCVDCGKPHSYASDLKTHYKLHKQENLDVNGNHNITADLPPIEKHVKDEDDSYELPINLSFIENFVVKGKKNSYIAFNKRTLVLLKFTFTRCFEKIYFQILK